MPSPTLKACLNGDRTPQHHPAVPLTPAQLAADAAATRGAGATAVHMHPRGADGVESMRWTDVGAAVAAVRARCPGLPIGVSTREQIEPDVPTRLRLIAEWPAPADGGPAFASVNWHENGAAAVAGLLAERGIGVGSRGCAHRPRGCRSFRKFFPDQHRDLRICHRNCRWCPVAFVV
ncbi:3-keto-5-aminohexanoate cleavage protein [Pseudonocardia sp. GCM10023141]|uniref:3-keto-5-aminohexanoate cleavage protein n=1 Tax=Pseudonocardia sp. GCM10023141 TaxID=3252653 RepID=UPI00360BD138